MKASSYLIPRCPGTSRLGEIGIADRLYFEIGLMLASDVVHGDLSNLDRFFEKQGLRTDFVKLLNKL